MAVDKNRSKINEESIKEVSAGAHNFFDGFFSNDIKANEKAEQFLKNNLDEL